MSISFKDVFKIAKANVKRNETLLTPSLVREIKRDPNFKNLIESRKYNQADIVTDCEANLIVSHKISIDQLNSLI